MKTRAEYLSKHEYKIWQGKDGKWYTYLPDEETGRVLKKRTTKKAIENDVIDFWKQQETNPTVRQMYNEWIKLKVERGEVTRSTKDRYDRQFEQALSLFGNRKIRSVKEIDIEDAVSDAVYRCKLTAKAFSNLRTILYGIFRRARKSGFVPFNIVTVFQEMDISRKAFRKTQKRDDELVFMEAEQQKLFSYFESRENDIIDLGILLMFKTGLRPGELVSLKMCDITENAIHVCRTEVRYKGDSGEEIYEVRDFPKTEAGIRDVALPDNAAWILKDIRHLNPFGEYLFERKGKRIREYNLSHRLRTICQRLSITVKSPNKIRKTYGSILIDNGVSESLVISQMGHTDIRTTKEFYYKNRKNVSEKVEAINRVIGL